MNRKLFSVRRLAPIGVLALVAGAAGAQAAGGGASAAKPSPPRAVAQAVPAVPVPIDLLPAIAPYMALSPATGSLMPISCRPPGQKPAVAPPSEALKDAFGILRRERTDDDALPARTLAALRGRGLKVVDPQSTRLLRADRRARAWVVPVPDVDAGRTVVCRGARVRSRPAVTPREGLVVVSVGGAPGGGGGALRDLQRGLAAPSLEMCAGGDPDMLGVSGIVPDGVEAVFITAADGSATRADVRSNGYAFVLPRPRRPEPRYVVWTGADGTPHVQPLPTFHLVTRAASCRHVARLVRVTPDPRGVGCAPELIPGVLPAPPTRRATRARPRAPRFVRPRGERRAPGAPVLPIAPAPYPLPMALSLCAGGPPPIVLPGRAPALRVPRAVPPRPPAGARAPRAVPAPPRAPAPRPAPPRGP